MESHLEGDPGFELVHLLHKPPPQLKPWHRLRRELDRLRTDGTGRQRGRTGKELQGCAERAAVGGWEGKAEGVWDEDRILGQALDLG